MALTRQPGNFNVRRRFLLFEATCLVRTHDGHWMHLNGLGFTRTSARRRLDRRIAAVMWEGR